MSSSVSAVLPVPLEIRKGDGVNQPDTTLRPPMKKNEKAAKLMNELNKPPDSSSSEQDDLERIKGIGPATARALNSVGIYRYGDLVDFTPDSLAERLKTRIPSISPQRIERGDWLGQARLLAHHQVQPETSESEANEASTPSLENDEQSMPGKTSKENWRELGDFFVSFGYRVDSAGKERLQTKVHYSQDDKFEQWDGLVTDQLLNWMLNQANLSSILDVEVRPEIEEPAKAHLSQPSAEKPMLFGELFLDISDLWVSEVKTPIPVSGQYQMATLRAEYRLNLSGTDAIEVSQDQSSFNVELYLVDTQTNRSKLVSSYPDQLMPDKLAYEIQQDFPIPPAGRYQLFLTARLLIPGMVVTHLQGPIIRAEV